MPISQFLSGLRCNPAATDDQILQLTSMGDLDLPADYLAFLRQTNGAAGMIGKSYVVFLSVCDVQRVQETNLEFGGSGRYLVFATDGANTNYAFDTSSSPPCQIIRVDKIDEDITSLFAANFAECLERLSEQELRQSDIHFSKEQIADFLKRSNEVRRQRKPD